MVGERMKKMNLELMSPIDKEGSYVYAGNIQGKFTVDVMTDTIKFYLEKPLEIRTNTPIFDEGIHKLEEEAEE